MIWLRSSTKIKFLELLISKRSELIFVRKILKKFFLTYFFYLARRKTISGAAAATLFLTLQEITYLFLYHCYVFALVSMLVRNFFKFF